MSAAKHRRDFRVVEYHGSMRGAVLWCDSLSIIARVPGFARVYRSVMPWAYAKNIEVSVSFGGGEG